jgi:serine/threonine-protein kinase
MEFQIGEVVNGYRILGILGKGGMGEVFRVQNILSDRVEAMKVIRPELQADADFGDRFLREIIVHAKLDHPNVIHFYTAFRVENRICMILEYAEGASLHDRLRHGPLDVAEAAGYMDQVLSALSYAHGLGVIHRDIKPANIIISNCGVVKLTDFGIAKTAGVSKLTSTGIAVGSLYYMSPEQIRNEVLDARSDLYSLGVTFYEAVTGKRAVEGEAEYLVMNRHLEHTPAPPAELNPRIPADISCVIVKALAKSPAHRFQSAADFQAALRACGSFAQPAGNSAFLSTLDATVPAPPRREIDTARLDRLQARLLPILGPIAKVLIAKAAAQQREYSGLCASLAEHITDPRARDAFLRSCEDDSQSFPAEEFTGTSQPPTTRPTAANYEAWGSSELQAMKQKLAVYVGPIAGLLVDRAARKSKSREELCEKLAKDIPLQKDRTAFLSSLRSLSNK